MDAEGAVQIKNPGDTEEMTLTISEAIDMINDRPSIKLLFVAFLLLIPNLAMCFAVVGPAFTGLIPYTQWRCMLNSTTCLGRTSEMSKTEINNVADKNIFMDNHCKITLKSLDKSNTVMNLYNKDNQKLGAITITSSLSLVCDSAFCKGSSCSATQSISLTAKNPTCTFTFKHGMNVMQCDGNEVELSSVQCLTNAVYNVRNVKVIKGVEKVDLECPDSKQYNSKSLCGKDDKTAPGKLTQGTDFYWDTNGRTSFAMDWDLYCDREKIKSSYSALYFGGAMAGLFVCGTLCDKFGRKVGLMLGYIVAVISAVLGALPSSVTVLPVFMLMRFCQGFGCFAYFSIAYVFSVEFTPNKYRTWMAISYSFSWDTGFFLLVLCAYYIKSWNWLAVIPAFLTSIMAIALPFIPETPRHLLVNANNEKGAKESLQWLADMNNVDIDMSRVQLVLGSNEQKSEKMTWIQTFKDFAKYREMTIQASIQMIQWIILAFTYYSFTFSWGKLGKDIYLGYLYAAVGDVVSGIMQVFVLMYCKRRSSMSLTLIAGGLTFLLALIPLDFGTDKLSSLEQLMSLIGSTCVALAWGMFYLYAVEASPTTHRAKLASFYSLTGRLGAMVSPFANQIHDWSKTGFIIIFAVLSISCGLAMLRLPETKDVDPPNTAQEVQQRRDELVKQGGTGVGKWVQNIRKRF